MDSRVTGGFFNAYFLLRSHRFLDTFGRGCFYNLIFSNILLGLPLFDDSVTLLSHPPKILLWSSRLEVRKFFPMPNFPSRSFPQIRIRIIFPKNFLPTSPS